LVGGGGVLGLGVVQASHVRDETGFRRVQVGHDHSVGTGVWGGSSLAVRSITSDFGIALGIGLMDDEDIGLVFVFAEGGIDLGGRGAIPGGIEVDVEVEVILLGPAVFS
jgi:hypothetical protein